MTASSAPRPGGCCARAPVRSAHYAMTTAASDAPEPYGMRAASPSSDSPDASRGPAPRPSCGACLSEGREATPVAEDDEELRAAGVPGRSCSDPEYVRASLVLPDMEMFDAPSSSASARATPRSSIRSTGISSNAPGRRWRTPATCRNASRAPSASSPAAACSRTSRTNLLTNPELVKSVGRFLLRHTGNDKDFLCSRLSYLLDLKGPSITHPDRLLDLAGRGARGGPEPAGPANATWRWPAG